ncbi:hypothetical protein F6Y05_05385 [Bacillus megaterium]|nr:hypothetical protein [Priestia megaterium]
MKEGYGNYIQKQREESAQNVDSILERVTAEETYYSTKTQAIKNGWMTKEEVVKLEHQVDLTMRRNEKGSPMVKFKNNLLLFKTVWKWAVTCNSKNVQVQLNEKRRTRARKVRERTCSLFCVQI